MNSILEQIAQDIEYDDLPHEWRLERLGYFSQDKKLYTYQREALKKAATILHLYYANDGTADEDAAIFARKKALAECYDQQAPDLLRQFNIPMRLDKGKDKDKIKLIAPILERGFTPQKGYISFTQLINRMCFWMATGSGKTLVMVKLMQYIYQLKEYKLVPSYDFLLLAPSDLLLGQIKKTVNEFNRGANAIQLELLPLRRYGREGTLRYGNVARVYYWRGDNIRDEQKKALLDYRLYENDGKWFVFLDEAHKGGKEDSKRQAYYSLMARRGFLFNFSATFTEEQDVATTVAKFNLSDFIGQSYGKNILLDQDQFQIQSEDVPPRQEISEAEQQRILLKSLINLAAVIRRQQDLVQRTKIPDLYHRPLMLTLVNSVGTEESRNDLLRFFKMLQELASGDIRADLFEEAKDRLRDEWNNGTFLFGDNETHLLGKEEKDGRFLTKMTIPDLRAAVFHAPKRGAIEVLELTSTKEIAFQLQTANKPFGLIRIGEIRKWQNKFLAGFQRGKVLETSFFNHMDDFEGTILMGSRAFFESWDSNRPNVINFINIGSQKAQKFIVQSVGRGVRIQPLPIRRGRLKRLLTEADNLPENQVSVLKSIRSLVPPVEALFIYATNREAIKQVLENLKTERGPVYQKLSPDLFRLAPPPKIKGKTMPLFVPMYDSRKRQKEELAKQFGLSACTRKSYAGYLRHVSDAFLMTARRMPARRIRYLRGMFEAPPEDSSSATSYSNVSILERALSQHLGTQEKIFKKYRQLEADQDIVHFRHIATAWDDKRKRQLEEDIRFMARPGITKEEKDKKKQQVQTNKMDPDEYVTWLNENERKDEVRESEGSVSIRSLEQHYYIPILVNSKKRREEYLRHIIQEESEANFLTKLATYIKEQRSAAKKWDGWMFSKLDETLDTIYIPYIDKKSMYRRFYPDFIFWLCRADHYRIVFVDPKGMAHTNYQYKANGYAKLFGKPRNADHRITPDPFITARKWNVDAKLLLFASSKDEKPDEEYKEYWTQDPADIFAP